MPLVTLNKQLQLGIDHAFRQDYGVPLSLALESHHTTQHLC